MDALTLAPSAPRASTLSENTLCQTNQSSVIRLVREIEERYLVPRVIFDKQLADLCLDATYQRSIITQHYADVREHIQVARFFGDQSLPDDYTLSQLRLRKEQSLTKSTTTYSIEGKGKVAEDATNEKWETEPIVITSEEFKMRLTDFSNGYLMKLRDSIRSGEEGVKVEIDYFIEAHDKFQRPPFTWVIAEVEGSSQYAIDQFVDSDKGRWLEQSGILIANLSKQDRKLFSNQVIAREGFNERHVKRVRELF